MYDLIYIIGWLLSWAVYHWRYNLLKQNGENDIEIRKYYSTTSSKIHFTNITSNIGIIN